MANWLSIGEAARWAQLEPAELFRLLQRYLVPADYAVVHARPGVTVRSMVMCSPAVMMPLGVVRHRGVTHVLAADFDEWLAVRAAELLASGDGSKSSPQCGAISPHWGGFCTKPSGHVTPHLCSGTGQYF